MQLALHGGSAFYLPLFIQISVETRVIIMITRDNISKSVIMPHPLLYKESEKR